MQLDALPDIRQHLVDALCEAIGDGSYQISPQAIATAMLTSRRLKVR
jgi:anti-sigma28 factor (negative regulator of flagellin synthesis)